MLYPLVSVIVPCREVDQQTQECVSRCGELDYDEFEVIVLPDNECPLEGAKVVATGPVSPGKKRNIGASVARGEVLAYIDSDAYPRRDWLAKAVAHLEGDGVGAVGGPGVTPPEDGLFAHAQGAILSSFLMGGISARYAEKRSLESSDDIHSVNLVAWKRVVEEAGGWNEDYWPGEDTLFCLSLKRLGYKLLFARDVVVYHHRRGSWRGYLRQIWGYGLHRGFFAKRFPETSRRTKYFFPSLFLLGLLIGPLVSLVLPTLGWVVLAVIVIYFAAVMMQVLINPRMGLMILLGLPLTHLTYGAAFLKGVFSRRLSK
jgi:cellulose synthase/poly-beta-1,6-N-acetylglucosamine synthase-like glycosyltransferase